MIDYTAKPFCLDDKGIRWVEETFASMTEDEKLGQLFIQMGKPDAYEYLDEKILKKHVGGILFRGTESHALRRTMEYVQKKAKVPLLACANLEEGGIGLLTDGTYFSKQMGVAATGDPHYAYLSGKVSASEAGAAGCMINFGPVVDMVLNWQNGITNTNSFGTDPDKVYAFAAANMKGMMECGMATCIKHFPGEGVDDRDQHYQSEVNTMSVEEWDATFGKVFRKLFEDGAMAVMPGHIAMPAYQKLYNKDFGDRILPATFSKELLTDLLRGKLGFNGLCISDGTKIAGSSCYMSREKAVPQMIEAGIDLILYSYDMDEDVEYLKACLASGLLSRERVEEAVLRNLAVKAALGLPEKQKAGTLVPDEKALEIVGCGEHLKWAAECADHAVTLVKDEQEMLPVDPEKKKKVRVILMCDPWEREDMSDYFEKALKERGFEPQVMVPGQARPEEESVKKFKAAYDWQLYVGRVESAHKDKTVLRINWSEAATLPMLTEDVPAVYLSLGNPFDLYDVPMMKTYINAYTGTHTVIDAALDKITGSSGFKGISPDIDPTCGLQYL
ncbi:MAG: glycoside hydrolase family 3 protein [Lachnospiraceae bacterium]|nr:glycoside hydrolase family 3 protein [Lachnospiraceae bacterium]